MPAPDPKRLRRAGACAVVLDDRGRVLLHKRTDNGRWALPGGAIETGETAEAALGISHKVSQVFQGILLLCILGCDALVHHRIALKRLPRLRLRTG